MHRGHWQNRLGIYFASIGSALNLGNFWRFPYMVAENGGGAFLFLFLVLLFLVGLPLLILELILGHKTKQGVLLGMQSLLKKPFLSWVGWLPVILSGCILVYYSVVAGWLLHFVFQFLKETLFLFSPSETSLTSFVVLSKKTLWQLSLASVHILVVSFIVLKGVERGLEKVVQYLTPLALVLILAVILNLLRQESNKSLWIYLFYPDFSKLSSQSLLMGLGQVFFATSLGMGLMVSYGSYLKGPTSLPTVGFRIVVIDMIIAVFAAIMIFGMAQSLGYHNLSDPGLLFVVIPSYFLEFSSGAFLGLAFFVVLYLVSILSSIGLLEVLVSNLSDYFGWGRLRSLQVSSLFIVSGIIFFLLGSTFLGLFKIQWLVLLDAYLVHFILPLVVVVSLWLVQKYIPKVWLHQSFFSQGVVESISLYKEWVWSLRWVIPVLLVISFFVGALGLFFPL
jgi:neurotransmitter:Na+ symporter, NSS family